MYTKDQPVYQKELRSPTYFTIAITCSHFTRFLLFFICITSFIDRFKLIIVWKVSIYEAGFWWLLLSFVNVVFYFIETRDMGSFVSVEWWLVNKLSVIIWPWYLTYLKMMTIMCERKWVWWLDDVCYHNGSVVMVISLIAGI